MTSIQRADLQLAQDQLNRVTHLLQAVAVVLAAAVPPPHPRDRYSTRKASRKPVQAP